MAEPSNTPSPEIKQGKGPEALPWGEAAQVNDLVGLVPPQEQPPFQPQGDAQQFIYGPSDRPNEPFSHGLPFGPGANATRASYETDDQLMARVAIQAANDPNAPSNMKAFAKRALQGQ